MKPNETHIISARGFKIFDGEGRYIFYPLFQTRKIINKGIITLEFPFTQVKTHFEFDTLLSIVAEFDDPKLVAEKYEGKVIGPKQMKAVIGPTVKRVFHTIIGDYETISSDQLLGIAEQIMSSVKIKAEELEIIIKEVNLELIDLID